MLKLAWTNFFDDFIMLSRQSEVSAVDGTIALFFRLLGWAVSAGEKDLPFATSFRALGIDIDLSEWRNGVTKFSNTGKRVTELVETIDSVLKSGHLPHQSALALRGRMQFAHAQLWGRASKLCLNAVTAHACSSSGTSSSQHLAKCLEAFKDSLLAARPREVSVLWDAPFFLFTDASFDPNNKAWPCGIGGVLFSPDEMGVSYRLFPFA